MNTKKLSLVLLSVIMAFALCAFAACNRGGGDDTYKAGEEVGSYYCVKDGAEVKLTLAEDGTATLVLGDENFSGPCQKDEKDSKKITMSFGDSSDLIAQATYANNVMTVSFRSTEYRFLRDVEYTVTFNSNGGSAVNSVPVRNGKTVAKPADPKKGDLIFLGWYKDNDTFKEPYQFGAEAVTGNITLYACYGESAEGEFDVTYNPGFDGGEVKSLKTSNGIAEILAAPSREGYEFLGWYVSDYEDPSKLTYKYEGQTLYQNTVLYGAWASDTPVVSVYGNTISWRKIANGSYSVRIYDAQRELIKADNVSAAGPMTELTYEYDFSELPAGEYEAAVKFLGKEGSAYFKHKALPKVSLFKVANGTALTYNSVPNAEEYILSIDCGNKYHKHSALSNGLSTTYNFANCDMQKDGIKFTVTAKAEGYLSSVSKEFSFEQSLAAVQGLKATDDGKLTWNAVENAEAYVVTIKAGEVEQTLNVKTTEVSIKEYGMGAMTFAVQAIANNYYSPAASMINYQKSTLASPKNIILNQTTLTWEGEQGATYNVKIGDKVYKANTNSLALEESYFSSGNRMVSVQAVKGTSVSLYSDPVMVKSSLTEDMVSYANGYVTWGNVFGAVSYIVEVDGVRNRVEGNVHSYKLDFKSSGEHTVKVSAYGSGVTGAVTLNLSLYSVYFESNGGTTVSTSYLAKGDYLTLPESAKGGYNFAGWYNAVGGASSNGKEYINGEFNYTSDVTMYANWTPKPINITIKWKDGDEVLTDTQTVYYKEQYTLPVPQIEPNGYAFGGWYLGSIAYTDQNGKSLIKFDRIDDVTLEANFIEVLKFELVKDESDQAIGYAVKKGDKINLVTEVTVPALYNDKPVISIPSSAFESATYLRVINIPDTVSDIFIPLEGISHTGSSFEKCSHLEAINIVDSEVQSADKGKYFSEDGVLYRYNKATEKKELYAYPNERMGAVVIADGVESIRSNVFKSGKMSSVTIPSSVTKIEAQAFGSNKNLVSVTFEPAKEGEEVKNLEIDDEAFYSCSNLLEVTFPARMQEFNRNMFRSCSAVSFIDFEEGSKYASVDGVVTVVDEGGANTLYWYPTGKAGDYTIPNGITKIADYAFTTRFESSTSTQDNPVYSYYGNKVIEKVTIPGYVTRIGIGAFRGCNKVKEVNFLGTATDNALTIEKDAFYGLTNEEFTEVTLPENLVYLGESAFGGCTKLVTVNLNSVDCSNFQTAAFANNALYYVTTLNIGEKAGAIEISGVFGTKLENVKVDPKNENYIAIDNVVYDKAVTSVLFYPAEKQGAYTTPDTVQNIGANVFRGRTGLTKVTIGKNVTSIGTSAFESCSKLESIVFEEGGTADLVMGDNVFKACSLLTSIALPERTTEVGSGLFINCHKVETVSLPASLVIIGYAFDKTLGENVFDMFPAYSSSLISEVVIAADNPKYASLDGVVYEKDENGNPVIMLYCPVAKTGTVDAPKTITKIATKAFAYSHAEKLIFSQGIADGATLEFGKQVFHNSSLTEIVLPEGLTEIADQMFDSNKELVKIGIPTTAVKIGYRAFYKCLSLETITIPKGVEVISKEAFASCEALQSITIPNTVKTIEGEAFANCIKLVEIIFAEGNDAKDADGNYVNPLTIADGRIASNGSYGNIYYGVFYKTPVAELAFPARTARIGTYLFGYSDNESATTKFNETLKRVEIPSTIKSIGMYAFTYCQGLETVEFKGDGVSKLANTKLANTGTNIQKECALTYTFNGCASLKKVINLPETSDKNGYSMYSTFSGCTSLESVEIPKTVVALYAAFGRTNSLRNVTFREGSMLEKLGDESMYGIGNVFSGCTSLTTIELPSGLKTIGPNAFKDVTSLTSIVIPETVTTIGYQAFSGCKSLTSVTFATYKEGENVGKCDIEDIQYQAFANTAITEFTFPVSTAASINLQGGGAAVAYLGRQFKGANSLTKVNLSKSVTDIEYVLEDCASITTINIADDNESFTTKEGSPYIYNKDGTGILFLYGATPKGHLVIPEGITEIAAYVFKGQVGITEVTIPYTVGKLGAGAFDGCMNLTKINFQDTPDKPSALQTVGENAFANCVKLAEVNLPNSEGFATIAKNMFMRCALTSITIPKSVVTIGKGSFSGNRGLTVVDLPLDGNLQLLDEECFYQTALVNVIIPASVTKIGVRAFQNIQTLKTVTFARNAEGKTSITTIMGSAFGGSSSAASKNLESIEIPKSVTTLTGSALSYITGLKSVTFEEGSKVASITSSVFRETGIQSITIPASVTKIEGSAFQDCKDLTKVTFEAGSKCTSIGSSAFKGCDLLAEIDFGENSKLATIDTNAFEGCSSLTSIKIPDLVNTIKKRAFLDCTALATVEFTKSSSLKTLEDQVFENCTSLKSINLPNGALTTIPQYAFLNCSSLVTIDIPDNVTTFKNYVFTGCTSLETVNFGEDSKLTTIGTYIFADAKGSSTITPGAACTSLKTIAIPDGVTMLGNYMFYNCTALETVTFGENSKLNFLGTNTFRNSGLQSIEVPKGVTILGTSATACTTGSSVYTFANCDRLTSVTFKGNITKIGGYVFFDCNNLVMDIPETVTLLGINAFAYTPATTFTIPKGLTAANIGNAPFGGCQNLTSIKVAEGNTTVMVDEATGALLNVANASAPKVICYPAGLKGVDGVVTIPSNMGVTIQAYAFMGCSDISVILPSDMETVPAYAFALSNVTSVTIPKGVKAIANNAFQNSKAITEIALPDSLTSIGNSAFEGCSGLTKIAIPAGVTVLGSTYAAGKVFLDCTSLKEVIFKGNSITLGGYVFKGCTALTSITLPASVEPLGYAVFKDSGLTEIVLNAAFEKTDIYSASDSPFAGSKLKKATVNAEVLPRYIFANCEDLTEVTLGGGVTAIPQYAFQNCTSLTTVNIPDTVTSIEINAFEGCTALSSINIPASVTSIGNKAFKGCTALSSFNIPASVTSIGQNVFENSGLQSITIPATVETFGTYMFKGSEKLESVAIETTVPLANYAFQNCTALKNVTFMDGVTDIPNYAFDGCSALEQITLPQSLTYLGSYSFRGTGLKSITIPAGVKDLKASKTAVASYSSGSYAFADCVNLTEVILPEGLETICSGVFDGCTSLKKINIPETVTILGNYTFRDCVALEEVNIPAAVTDFGSSLFLGCTSLKQIVIREPLSYVGSNVFSGWTADQKVYLCFGGSASKAWAQNSLTNYWYGGSEATLVWDYVEENQQVET